MLATTTLDFETSRWIQVENGTVKSDWLLRLNNRRSPAELKAALPPVLHWPVINAIQNNCLAVSKTAGELTDKIKHSIFRVASLSYLLRPSALRSNPCR
ncbi:Uncharacterized protein HZ326_5729 [Fusarium oxysporum f. sp. albedinis]|nr:Uncharacterized protein HZ326_5729 [Fusarium oxysporum f. sp. albedinis]